MAAIGLAIPALTSAVMADGRSYGYDQSKYQGSTTYRPYARDQFSIAQVGGYANGYYYDQWTYPTQVSTGIAQGIRMHTYIWYQVGGNVELGRQVARHFLAKTQTPKGSIVALDYEDGASWDKNANTEAVLAGMREIKAAGYTPMYYSYKPYTLSHVDYSRIIAEFPDSGWIAAYPDYQVRSEPFWGVFPSMPGIGIYQFTSTYRAGGLDGNISLAPGGRDVTMNGYRKGQADQPKSTTPAISAGIEADNTPKKDIAKGYTVKVNYSASRWAGGQAIPGWVKGKTYQVIETSGNNVLLGGVMSWISKNNVEILSTGAPINAVTSSNTSTAGATYTVKCGDSFWSIANKMGMNMYTLAANNGLSINSVIHPGQVLKIRGNTTGIAHSYIVKYGDTLSVIAARLGTTVNHLQTMNGIQNANIIRVGQVLRY